MIISRCGIHVHESDLWYNILYLMILIHSIDVCVFVAIADFIVQRLLILFVLIDNVAVSLPIIFHFVVLTTNITASILHQIWLPICDLRPNVIEIVGFLFFLNNPNICLPSWGRWRQKQVSQAGKSNYTHSKNCGRWLLIPAWDTCFCHRWSHIFNEIQKIYHIA